MVLNLKRKCKGVYEVQNDAVRIVLWNGHSAYADEVETAPNEWRLMVIDKVNRRYLLRKTFETKKEALAFGEKWIVDRLVQMLKSQG